MWNLCRRVFEKDAVVVVVVVFCLFVCLDLTD